MSVFSREEVPVRITASKETPIRNAADFASIRFGMTLDPKQDEALRSEAKRAILNCCRQWGKSTIAAVKAVYRASTQPEKLVLIASPSQRQSELLLRKAAGMVAALGIAPRGDGGVDPSLCFPNGSRIVGLPGTQDTVRGFSAASLLIIDEAARVSGDMYRALRPMLAVGDGDLWLMSTPLGKSGFFYETWSYKTAPPGDEEDWLRISVPATDCPRISKRFLEEERGAMGPDWFSREYMCAFVDTGRELFGRDMIERALVDEDPWPLR